MEIYNTDGAQGAARGSGIGVGYYKNESDAFKGLKVIDKLHPDPKAVEKYEAAYQQWKESLLKMLED